MRRVPLGSNHPLAQLAARHCERHTSPLVGGVACGGCWERAIRDDERAVVEWGLPPELVPNPNDIDEVAVERACGGERTPLTAAELSVAAHRLRRWGLYPVEIGRRLHVTYRVVIDSLNRANPQQSETPTAVLSSAA